MYNCNKAQVSAHDPTKLAIHTFLRLEDDHISDCGHNFQNTLPFDDIVHLIEEETIVTYVGSDCGITFYPETPTNIRQNNRERNYNSRLCEKPKCIPSNDQHNCSIDEQHTSYVSF